METHLTPPKIKPKQRRTSRGIPTSRHELGQFLTPQHVAALMSLFFCAHWDEVELLDAGAGGGDLSAALVKRLCSEERKPKRIVITAYEVDSRLVGPLKRMLRGCQNHCERAGISFTSNVVNGDFISAAVSALRGDLFSPPPQSFNAAIVNPPYKKLRGDSNARLLLRSVGIETSNYYSAFVALIQRLLSPGGELVAITPRSFCNGPYFKTFRAEFLDSMSIERLHLFQSRSAAFGRDNVLQENIIVHAIKDKLQSNEVILSSSSGHPNGEIIEQSVPYAEVVSPEDSERFIHVGIAEHPRVGSSLGSFDGTLADLDFSVSTGRVVDFRVKPFLRRQSSEGTVPLIYPSHFNGGLIAWPKQNSRKANSILVHDRTRDLLLPSEVYVLVKRFTSKEERRRIVACIYDPSKILADWVAFENHLNYFHLNGRGIQMNLARGLTAFLNSSVVDSYFRRFSGHTQVNATDLRKLKYPCAEILERLGSKIEFPIGQVQLDDIVERELNANQKSRPAGVSSQAQT